MVLPESRRGPSRHRLIRSVEHEIQSGDKQQLPENLWAEAEPPEAVEAIPLRQVYDIPPGPWTGFKKSSF